MSASPSIKKRTPPSGNPILNTCVIEGCEHKSYWHKDLEGEEVPFSGPCEHLGCLCLGGKYPPPEPS